MKRQIKLLLITILLLVGQDAISKQVPTILPNTSSWITLLERTTGISYSSGHRICARFTKPYRNKGNKEMDVIVTNMTNNKNKFMFYRYTIPLHTSSEIKIQMGLLYKAGLLDVDEIIHEGRPARAYRLTKKGWGESLINSTYSHSLCFETGKWKVNKVLDYQLFDDQGSGLKAYKIKYETEYELKDWVSSEMQKAFKQKRTIPKQLKTVLVKGPSGYFNPNPGRNRGLYNNTIMPSPVEGTRIAKSSDKFLTRLCMIHNQTHHIQGRKCTDKDKPSIKKSLIVYNVGIPSRGNITVFKFSFTTPTGVDKYGRGRFRYSRKKGWEAE